MVRDTLWAVGDDGRTPAVWAELCGHQAVVDYLSKPWTPLIHAATDRRAADVERLLRQGADPTISVTREHTFRESCEWRVGMILS